MLCDYFQIYVMWFSDFWFNMYIYVFVLVFVYVHVPNCFFVYFTYMILWLHYTYLFMHGLLFSLGMLSWVFYGPHPSHSSGCCRYFLLHFWGCAHATSKLYPTYEVFHDLQDSYNHSLELLRGMYILVSVSCRAERTHAT